MQLYGYMRQKLQKYMTKINTKDSELFNEFF